MERRKEEFYDNYLKKLVIEASRIGITQEELINMIKKAK